MSPEQKYTTDLKKPLTSIFIISLIAYLGSFSFSIPVAIKIKERAGGKCENCGKSLSKNQQIAAHLHHDHNSPNYDDPRSGKCFCAFCEMSYHYKHHSDPSTIGIRSQADNRSTIISWYYSLHESEKRRAIEQFGQPFKSLIGIR